MKKNLTALIIASMSVGLLIGCGPSNQPTEVPSVPDTPTSETPDTTEVAPLPTKYSLMKNWSGHMEETIYEVDDTTDKTVISYTDAKGENAGGWEYVARPFAFDAAVLARFGEYKKLVITGKLDVTEGTDIVMVKLEGSTMLETKFNFGPEEKTYELSLATIANWSTMTQMLFFVNRGTSLSGSGVMTFTDISLSKEEINPENDINANLPSVPQDVNLYNGQEKFVVMNSWGYNQDNNIKTEAKDGKYHFTYGEGSKTNDWAYVSAKIQSGSKELQESGFQRVHFTISGTAGTNALIKFEKSGVGAVEFMIAKFTGEVEEYDLAIPNLLKESVDANYLAMIFPAAGKNGADLTGEVVLHECYLDATPAVDPNAKYINQRVGDVIEVKALQNQEDCYEITSENTKHTIKYNMPEVPTYRAIKVLVGGENVNELTHITGTLTSTANVSLIIKPYDQGGANEVKIALTANEPKTLDITFAKAIVDANKPTIIMIGTGADDAKVGTLTIDGMKFEKPAEAVLDPDTNYVANDEINITKFVAYNKDLYTITNKDNVTTIKYAKTAAQDWDNIQFKVGGENLKAYTHLTGTVKSDVKSSLIVKPMDAIEAKFEHMEANTEYKIDVTVPAEKMIEGQGSFIFVAFSADSIKDHGTITITNLKFEKPLDPTYNYGDGHKVAINTFVDYDEKLYTITNKDNVTTIDYHKTNAEDWVPVKFKIGGDDLNNYVRLTATVKSTVKSSIIVKPYDHWNAEYKIEPMEANTEYKIDKIIPSEAIDGTKAGLIFIGFGADDIQRTGKITLTNLQLESVAHPELNYSDANGIKVTKFTYDKSLYTITNENNVTTIKFDKTSDKDWEQIRFNVAGENLGNFLHLKGKVKADVATSFIIKPYDAVEYKQEPMEANKEYEFDIVIPQDKAVETANCIIFIAFGAPEIVRKGTITLTDLRFVAA